MAQEGSDTSDAFTGSPLRFMQAGQDMAQQFMAFIGQAGNPGAGVPPVVDPQALIALQKQFMDQQISLWRSLLTRQPGEPETFKVAADAGDRRFAAPEWRASPVFDYLHQAYLLNSKFLKDLVELIPASDD